jgi:hypothetical protein
MGEVVTARGEYANRSQLSYLLHSVNFRLSGNIGKLLCNDFDFCAREQLWNCWRVVPSNAG